MAPNIPIYNETQNVSPAPFESTAYSLERFARVEQGAVEKTGEGLAGLANQYQLHQVRSELMDFQDKSSAYEVNQLKDYEQQKADHGDDTSWVGDWLDKYKQGHQQLGEQYATHQVQAYANEHTAAAVENMSRKVFSEAAETETDAQITKAHSTVQNYANIVAAHPDLTQYYADQAAHAAVLVPGPHRDAEVLRARSAVYDSSLESLVSRAEGDPNRSVDSIDALAGYLKDEKSGFISGASDKAYANAIARLNNLRTFRVGAQSTADEAFLTDGFKQMQENGGFDNDNRIMEAIKGHRGANEQETQKWQTEKLNDFNKAQWYGQEAAVIKKLPEGQIGDHLADLQHDLDVAPLEQAGPARERYEAAQKILRERDVAIHGNRRLGAADYYTDARNFKENYVLLNNAKNAPPEQQPGEYQKFFANMNNTQQTIDPGQVPMILPSQMRDSFAQRLNAVTTNAEGATQAAAILGELQRVTGPKYWMQAVHELETTGTLKSGQYPAALMFQRPESMALAQETLRAASIPRAEMDKISPVTEAQARTAAQQALSPLSDTLHHNFDGDQAVSGFVDALTAVMRQRGTVDGADALAHQMILGQFQSVNGMRIPNNVTASAAVNMTSRVQTAIDKLPLDVPQSYSGLGPVEQREQYGRYIASNGQWATNASGDGAMLFAPDGTPVRVKQKDGSLKQVEVKWNKIQGSDQTLWDRLMGNKLSTGAAASKAPAAPKPAPVQKAKAAAASGGWSVKVAD